jgi:hypothetical protein
MVATSSKSPISRRLFADVFFVPHRTRSARLRTA